MLEEMVECRGRLSCAAVPTLYVRVPGPLLHLELVIVWHEKAITR